MKIKIDDKEYDTDEMSKEAIAQIQAIQITDTEITRCQLLLASLQTARNAYGRALKEILDGNEDTDDKSSVELPDNLTFD